MNMRNVTDNVFWLGAVDWDRRLFDSLVPLPDGTSYNAYLVRGTEKTALLDTVDPTMSEAFMRKLEGVPRIDFLVSHHAEQDHSGTIPQVLERYPEAQLVTSVKAKTMLMDLLRIPETKIRTVEDGETIDLGSRTLKFLYTPWVHWPETMSTFLEEERILFSGDFFGSHIASSDLIATDKERVYEAAKRYYAEIMMPFRTVIVKNLEKLKGYDIRMIAPSHGQIYDQPAGIMDAYQDWVDGALKNTVALPCVSMHGSTRIMVDHLVAALVERGVRVELFNLVVTDIGRLAMALVDAGTVVIATPTVLAGPHPLAAYAAMLTNALRPRVRFLSVIGSYGWGGRTVETLTGMTPNLKAEVLEPVLCKGVPGEGDFDSLNRLADAIAQKHRENGFT